MRALLIGARACIPRDPANTRTPCVFPPSNRDIARVTHGAAPAEGRVHASHIVDARESGII